MRRRFQFSLRQAFWFVGAVCVLIGVLAVPFWRQAEWMRLYRQMDTTVRHLKPTQPRSITDPAWDCAHGWVITAYCNICFSPEHTTTAEMYRLRDDLESNLKDQVDFETLKWIWARLGETGPHGQRYIDRFGASFRDCLPLETNLKT